MRKLEKPTSKKSCPHRRRFDAVCLEIRKALKIDHYQCCYHVDAAESGDSIATFNGYVEGDYVIISLRPSFWETISDAWQIRALVHEHVHALLQPLTQAYDKIVDRLPNSDVSMAKGLFTLCDERVTCHVESVLFDLLKPRLEKI